MLLAALGGIGGAGSSTSAAGADTGASSSLGAIVIANLGPGYTVSSQGPLNASKFASDSPDPSAASGALASLGNMISTYERAWQANGGLNQVQDLLVRFPSATGAKVFVQAAQQSLDSGEIVSKGTLPSVPGSRLVTYFAATNESGVGEAITMQAGDYVALLSFFSAQGGNSQPISQTDAEKVAVAQHTAMASAPGGAEGGGSATTATTSASSRAAAPAKKDASSSDIGWAIVAVVIVAAAVATPLLLRRRRMRQAGQGGPPAPVTQE